MSKPYLLVFPGQSTHEPNMGHYWYENSSVFQKAYQSLLDYFYEKNGTSLENIIKNHPDQLELTQWAQPAIYCYQVAAAKMIMQHNPPEAIIGHSLGEFAAVVAADGMDPYKTLDLVTERGLLMQQTEPGKMIAVLCSTTICSDILNRHPNLACWISAENDESVTIIAGMPKDVDLFKSYCTGAGIRHLGLTIGNAFHTPMMESIEPQWKVLTQEIKNKSLSIPIYSSIDGKKHTLLPEDYWYTHLFARVRFKQALNKLKADLPIHTCIEVGPSNRFQTYLKKRWDTTSSTGPEENGKEIQIHLNEILYHS